MSFKNLKPYLAVILMQFGYAGTAIIAKAALNKGMNHYIFSVYRNAIAAICFAPFAYIIERKIRPRMTFSVLLKIALLALLEPVIDQNLYYAGMKYTTATFTSAMCNILPAITFLLAWALRLEKVNLKRFHDQAKVMGTIVTIGGAMIMTLIRGHVIGFPWTTNGINSSNTNNEQAQVEPIKGAIMIIIGCLCWSIFYILQANTLKTYPAGLSLTSLICMAGAIQGGVLALVVERGKPELWSVGLDIKLLAYAYAGIVSSGVGYYVSGVVSKAKGPVFLTSFNPLSMVVIAVMSSFVFADKLDVGKVVGASVIIVGLYLVIWSRTMDDHKHLSSSSLNSTQQEITMTINSSADDKFESGTLSKNNVV